MLSTTSGSTWPVNPNQTSRQIPPVNPSRIAVARKSVRDMATWYIKGNKAIVVKTRIPGSNHGMERNDSFIALDLSAAGIETLVFSPRLVKFRSSQAARGSHIMPLHPSAAARETGAVIIRMYCGHFVGQINKNTSPTTIQNT